MWQQSWLGRAVMKIRAPQWHWSTVFLAISILGTFIASILLVFDGWVDAVAVYLMCGLTLAVLLSRLAGQQTGGHEDRLGDDLTNSGGLQTGLVFKQASQVQLSRLYRASHPNVTVSPPALGEIASTD